MAKHKAPTQVTIAKTEEETELQALVRRYWLHGAIVAVVATGVIVFQQWRGQQSTADAWASWARLDEEVAIAGAFAPTFATDASAPVLADLADELVDSPAGPWAKVLEIGKRLSEEDVEGARRAMADLESLWPDHPLVTQPIYPRPEGDGPPRRLADHVEARLAVLAAWESAQPRLFSNPELPEGAPRVRFETSAGDIVIGLYAEQAPLHAANFLKLCSDGFYDGLKFHRVVQGSLIQTGDPNTRQDDDRESWGQGSHDPRTEPELGTSLWHFPHAVSAVAPDPGADSDGAQFLIVTGTDQHHRDGQYTVFGAVVEGEAVVTAIESGAVLGDRPEQPIAIQGTEVL